MTRLTMLFSMTWMRRERRWSSRAKALEAAAELAVARAKTSEDVALIAQQKLRIAKLERQVYGQRSERSAHRSPIAPEEGDRGMCCARAFALKSRDGRRWRSRSPPPARLP